MKKILSLSAAFAAVFAASVNAQTTVTEPVGFVSVTVPAASDAALGAPLGRPSEYVGDKAIQNIVGNVITVSNNSTWTTNQWVYVASTQPKTYFARIDSGLKEGLICTITANTANSLTVTLPAGEDLTTIKTIDVDGASLADSISIAPYWTPATLITGVVTGTNILRYPTTTPGTNLSSSSTYVFNGTDWLYLGNPINDAPFGPTEGFVLRNNSASPQTISITGAVPMTAFRRTLYTLAANTRQDQRFFYNSPVPETVGAVFPPSALAVGDNLLVYNNAASGKNKSSSATLVWNGTQWLLTGNDVTNTYQLTPGWSYLFRKAQTGANPANVVWSDLQSYLQ